MKMNFVVMEKREKMSILIKGMDMPNVCGVCKLADAIECDRWKHVRSVMLDRHKYCPLAEVSTPHGDLIDREEYKHFLEDKLGGCLVLQVHIAWLNEQPTIIESEE